MAYKRVYICNGYFVRLHISETRQDMFNLVLDQEGRKVKKAGTRAMFWGFKNMNKCMGDIYLNKEENLLTTGVHELYHAVVLLANSKKGELLWKEDQKGVKSLKKEELLASLMEQGFGEMLKVLS